MTAGRAKGNFALSAMAVDDREAVMDIFNYYVENSFAAYPEERLPYDFFGMFLKMAEGYPAVTVKDREGKVVGFGMLRAYHPMPAFAKTAETTCFIHPEYTGRGIGKRVLEYLEREGGRKGVRTLLASISSLNEGSIRFHRKNGFVKSGRFKGIGTKKGRPFDMVWMQKDL